MSVVCCRDSKKHRTSVRPSVRRLVGWLVMLLSKTGKSMVLITNNHVSCIHIIVQSFHHEDAFLALWALFSLTTRIHFTSACSSSWKGVSLTIFCFESRFLSYSSRSFFSSRTKFWSVLGASPFSLHMVTLAFFHFSQDQAVLSFLRLRSVFFFI